MKLSDLTYCQEHTLPRLHSMYRIQRTRRTASTVVIGAVRLPPTGLLTGRFDLPTAPVGYFAEEPETAAYETLARREANALSMGDLQSRSLLWVQLTEPVTLLDLRPHTPKWPVLTSLRFACTQELASDAARHGYAGLVYRSAQHYDHDCYTLFAPAVGLLRRVESMPLVDRTTGGLHPPDARRGPWRADGVCPLTRPRDNCPMTTRPPLSFTKMHGLGNDFVVLDATRAPLDLSEADLRFIGDRRFGIGADQILVVEPARAADADFRYRIFNGATGEEVEHCGNGARCFLRYVRDHGLTDRDTVRVETMNNRIVLEMTADGRITVDMNQPIFEAAQIPFDPNGLVPRLVNGFELWPLTNPADPMQVVEVAAVSMGNPHAVQRVEDVDSAPVATVGPWVEAHATFPRKVNAGFLQVVDRGHIRLRVHERGAGETLACGTGACAAVVAGIRLGWLDAVVDVDTRGGRLTIAWDGVGHSVRMTGPAVTVFEGTVAFPD